MVASNGPALGQMGPVEETQGSSRLGAYRWAFGTVHHHCSSGHSVELPCSLPWNGLEHRRIGFPGSRKQKGGNEVPLARTKKQWRPGSGACVWGALRWGIFQALSLTPKGHCFPHPAVSFWGQITALFLCLSPSQEPCLCHSSRRARPPPVSWVTWQTKGYVLSSWNPL